MSNREIPMIEAYWEEVGGTLIKEFPVVPRGENHGPRWIDAVIIPSQSKRIASWRDVQMDGEDVIVVQAKAKRLGMSLMGQAFFSAQLLKRKLNPASIAIVAICNQDDSVLRSLAEAQGIKVVVLQEND